MATVLADRKEADDHKQIAVGEEEKSKASVAEASELQAACEAELARATPALEAALQAVKELSKNDVAEVKALKSPPNGVKLTMETVCIMKGVRPRESKVNGKNVYDFWEPAKKMINDTNFLQALLDFDRDAITVETADEVRPYLSNPDFDPERVRKASFAACGLCKWVRAMMIYHEIQKDVVPKQRRLAEAKRESAAAQERLRETTNALMAIMAKLELLEMEYARAPHTQTYASSPHPESPAFPSRPPRRVHPSTPHRPPSTARSPLGLPPSPC